MTFVPDEEQYCDIHGTVMIDGNCFQCYREWDHNEDRDD